MEQIFSIENWRTFISNKICPIRDYAEALLNFWNFLKSSEGKYILDILSEYPELEDVFLGGTNKDGYTENSFAKIIKDVFGAYINVKAYYSYVIQGFEPKVPVEVEQSEMMLIIQAIKGISSRILELSRIKQRKTIYSHELMNNPNKVLEVFIEFLNRLLDICVGYSEYTTFCWNIRKITRKYLAQLYPDALRNENFEFLRDFLGLRELFVPNVDDGNIKDNYTILGFPDYCSIYVIRGRNLGSAKYPNHALELITNNLELPKDSRYYGVLSLPHSTDEIYTHSKDVVYLRAKTFLTDKTIGGSLLKLNELIWLVFTNFSSVLSQILQDVPNPKFEYLKACKAELEKIRWQEPRYLSEFMTSDDDRYYIPSKRGLRYWINEFTVDGILIKEGHSIYCLEQDRGYTIVTSVYSTFGRTLDEPFLIFLDEIMPAVCLGVYEIIFGKNELGKDTFVVIRR